VQGLFRHLQVRFGDGPWQDVKGLDEVGSDPAYKPDCG
ncbi:phage tail fiber C-terminal domain-containing protein, partial [Escherichia coli]